MNWFDAFSWLLKSIENMCGCALHTHHKDITKTLMQYDNDNTHWLKLFADNKNTIKVMIMAQKKNKVSECAYPKYYAIVKAFEPKKMAKVTVCSIFILLDSVCSMVWSNHTGNLNQSSWIQTLFIDSIQTIFFICVYFQRN